MDIIIVFCPLVYSTLFSVLCLILNEEYPETKYARYVYSSNLSYLPKYTIKIETSEGLTPLILEACPKVRGRMVLSF